jgi:cytochrome P450
MKFMSWLLTTSMVLPQLSAHAGQPQILSVDTKKLYLNNDSNSAKTSKDALAARRALIPKNHKKLGDVRDRLFTDMSKDHNLLNMQTGMTFWEEYQALQNGDSSVVTGKYDISILDPIGKLKFGIGRRVKPDLILFMTWMRANGLSTFKSLMGNDPDGILELESLKIDNAPYEIDGPTYVVTKYKDVVHALSNPETFSVRNYHQRMKDSVGNFMLGNDKKAINYEHTWARGLIDVSEMEPRIRPLVRSIFEQEMKSLEYIKMNPFTKKLEANIEVVNQIARRVPAILTIKYFGFEGISPEKIMEWSRATQDDFFHNVTGDETKAKVAVKAGQEMQAALVNLINAKFAQVEELAKKPRNEQTILDRMVISIGAINDEMSVDDLLQAAKGKVYLEKTEGEDLTNLSSKELVNRIKGRVRTNIIGTLVGGLETTQAAITQTLNLIFQDRDLTKKAKELSAAATADKNSQKQFNNLVWEVLRFHPVNPIVFRYVEKDTEIAGVKMKAKSHIMIATQAAMFDSEAFPNPEAIDLNRFNSPRDDKYFHLGFGHHRCLGDYVSMIQVPEIIAGILSLPNVRPMPGFFGELDFNKRTKHLLIGKDKADQSFPERMMLEYDSSDARPLVPKKVEIADRSVPFEGYLKDYDRNHFRGCLSGWHITQSKDGQIFYSPNGAESRPEYLPRDARYITKVSDFVGNEEMLKNVKEATDSKIKNATKSIGAMLRSNQGFVMNFGEESNDLLYCRLPMKFHACFEGEANKKGALKSIKHYTIRNRTEAGDATATETHKTIYNKCATFADLTETERAFYENRYFGAKLDESKLSLNQATRPAMWEKDFWYEDYFSAQEKYFYRASFTNPVGWKNMIEANKIDFYVRLNITFRMCLGPKVIKGASRCEAYFSCVNGEYNPLTFKYEGALSPLERKAYNQIMIADAPCEKLD